MIRGRVCDVWRGEVPNTGQPALGIQLDIPAKQNCFWIAMPAEGDANPVSRGDAIVAGPHHYRVNGGPERRKLSWMFDRNAPLH